MANEISVRLKAKDEASSTLNKAAGNVNKFSKQVTEATKPLNNFAKSFQNLSKAAPGIAVIGVAFNEVAKSIKSAVSEMLSWEKAYSEMETVEKRIDFAATINQNLGRTSKELQKFAEDTSSALKNAVSTDAINEQISKLSFDKTGDEIEKIIDVALDLSAALGIDLNTAVTQVNNTFSGSVGTLGKYFPELKNINDEGLKAGVALDLLKSKVGGLSAELSNSTDGSINRYKNSLDNLKESLGSLVTDFITPLRDSLASLFAELTNQLNTLDQRIANKKRIAAGGATSEEAQQQLDIWTQKYNEAKKNFESRKAWAEKTGANTDVDFYYQQYQADLDVAVKNVAAYRKMLQEAKTAETVPLVTPAEFKIDDKYSKTSSTLSTPVETLGEATNRVFTCDIQSSSWDPMAQYFNKYANSFTEFTTSQEADDEMLRLTIEDAERKSQETQQRLMYEEREAIAEAARLQAEKLEEIKENFKTSVLNNTGELGAYIKAYTEGGGYAVLAQFAGDILAKLSETSGIVNSTFNIVSTMISEFIEPLASIIEPVLNPLLVVVQSMGRSLGSMITVVTPLIEVMAKGLEITSMIKVWEKSFLTAFYDSIYQAFIDIKNSIIDIYNSLNGWGQDLNRDTSGKGWTAIGKEWESLLPQNFIDYYNSLLQSNINNLSPASTSTSTAGATYTAARDITVNINYVSSFVNGDAEVIAVNLAKEIRNVEKLGLI